MQYFPSSEQSSYKHIRQLTRRQSRSRSTRGVIKKSGLHHKMRRKSCECECCGKQSQKQFKFMNVPQVLRLRPSMKQSIRRKCSTIKISSSNLTQRKPSGGCIQTFKLSSLFVYDHSSANKSEKKQIGTLKLIPDTGTLKLITDVPLTETTPVHRSKMSEKLRYLTNPTPLKFTHRVQVSSPCIKVSKTITSKTQPLKLFTPTYRQDVQKIYNLSSYSQRNQKIKI